MTFRWERDWDWCLQKVLAILHFHGQELDNNALT
jgi:hypothetical protein